MKKALIILLMVLLVAASGGGVYYWQQTNIKDIKQQKADIEKNLQGQIDRLKQQNAAAQIPAITHKSQKGINITLYTPKADEVLSNPITIVGQVPGSWSFEGQFPVVLKNAQGAVIGQASATLQGEWMTDAYVPFTATISFKSASGSGGMLVLQKDNPSGLPDKDDQVQIPVRF